MNDPRLIVPYTLLQARGPGARAGEALNVGVVLHAPDGPRVAVTGDTRRLRALHPDFAALDLSSWGGQLEHVLRERFLAMPDPAQQRALLSLCARPFVVAEPMGMATVAGNPNATLRELMVWLVDPAPRTLRSKVGAHKRPTRLAGELRNWFRAAKTFSTKVDDLNRGKVVSNYPIDPTAGLYADFAVLSGEINAIETLDLRGVERLTPTMRGDAALKGITLDEAREHVAGRRIAVVRASDYGVAKPAIAFISRYADDVIDIGIPSERQRFSNFMAQALQRPQMPDLLLAA